MAKILHAADFHLDSAFSGLSAEQARLRRAQSREQVHAMVDYANDHGAELMLLAGDLFDGEDLYAQTGEELAAALSRFRGQVVIAPGNHDPYTPRSAYARLSWPENVHIFSSGTMEKIAFPQYGCTVYGAAFTGGEMPPWEGVKAEGGVTLGVLHGDVGSRDSKYRAILPAQIGESGLTYLALGHVHAAGGVSKEGGTSWAYAGCPEGRGFDELGEKGFYFGDVTQAGVELKFIPFARHHYEILPVDVTDRDPRKAVEAALPEGTKEDSYRILLQGECEHLDLKALEQALAPRFETLELRDETHACRDIWAQEGEDSLRGLFLRRMRRRLEDAQTEPEREAVLQAVRFGLDALDGRDLG